MHQSVFHLSPDAILVQWIANLMQCYMAAAQIKQSSNCSPENKEQHELPTADLHCNALFIVITSAKSIHFAQKFLEETLAATINTKCFEYHFNTIFAVGNYTNLLNTIVCILVVKALMPYIQCENEAIVTCSIRAIASITSYQQVDKPDIQNKYLPEAARQVISDPENTKVNRDDVFVSLMVHIECM